MNLFCLKSNVGRAVLSVGVSLSLITPAFAGEISEDDSFSSFYTTVDGWVGGALGTGLAITMLLMGAGIGVAKNSPMPALSGVAGAAFLNWGPDIIKTMMLDGALLM